MKYIKLTLQYLKSNKSLLIAYAIMAAACYLIIDHQAIKNVIDSFEGGHCSASYLDWLNSFSLINTSSIARVFMSIGGYAIIIFTVTYLNSILDRHMRFGTRSLFNIKGGMNSHISYALVACLILAVCLTLVSFIISAVLWAFSQTIINYFYIFGIIITFLMLIGVCFIASLFLLWLPCVVVTGFRMYEALVYSYQLTSNIKIKLFIALLVPLTITIVAICLLALYAPNAVYTAIVPLLVAFDIIYVTVLSFVAYMDADNVEREDLKKRRKYL